MKKLLLSIILTFALCISFAVISSATEIAASDDCGENTASAVTVNSIVVTPPTKNEYIVGDTLDTSGMIVIAMYSDGSLKNVTDEVTCAPVTFSETGDVTVMISYGEKSYEFTVKVTEMPVTSLVVTPPAKKDYYVGDTLDTTGMVVIAVYSDGTLKNVTDGVVCAPLTFEETGKILVTISFDNKESTFTVNVEERPDVRSLTVTPPSKVQYNLGDTLDTTGMQVIAYIQTLVGGMPLVVPCEISPDNVSITPTVFNSLGETVVTVSYEGKSATFTVNVIRENSIAEGKVPNTEIYWILDKTGTLIITGEGSIPDYSKSNSAPWISHAKDIKKIVVADGITGIGAYAFYNLSNVTEISLSDSVKSLGTQFIRGTAIEEITLPAVERIHDQAFARADILKVINAGESVKDIWGTIFFSETVTVKAPANSYMAKYAESFADFFTVDAKVSFEATGEATTPINYFGKAGESCFYAVYQNSSTNWSYEISGNGKMKNFPYVSAKYEALGYTFTPTYYMNGNERNILSSKVYDGVTTLGNYLFYKCTKITSYDLHDGITSIGRGVFQANARL